MQIAMVTSYGPQQEKLAEVTIPLMSAMCKRLNIEFFKVFDKERAKDRFIAKLDALKSIFQTNKFDWVFWTDIDIIPRKVSFSIREILMDITKEERLFLTAPSIGAFFAFRKTENSKKILEELAISADKAPDGSINELVTMNKIYDTLHKSTLSCYDDSLQTTRLSQDNHCWTYHAMFGLNEKWPITEEEKFELLTAGKEQIIW